jgi:hypothetical protein
VHESRQTRRIAANERLLSEEKSQMDGSRFDGLTRALASRSGRRAALRTALGLGAAVTLGTRTVAAKEPGDQCRSGNQCLHHYGSDYYCDDNGFDYDGWLNCCTYEWGGCRRNEDCCGGNSCLNNVCRYISDLAGAGKGCYHQRDCDAYGGTGLSCDFNDWDNSARVCCNYAGGACQYNGHCCRSLTCNNGFCG